MDMSYNVATVCGKIIDIEFSHEVNGKIFHRLLVESARFSDYKDVLPVIVNESMLIKSGVLTGSYVQVTGQIRSKSFHRDNQNRMHTVFLYAKQIAIVSEEMYDSHPNRNYFEAVLYVCKRPEYRLTSMGRKITELLLAHNRNYSCSDYIPSIAWGDNAIFAGDLMVGDVVVVTGRFQSRIYSVDEGLSSIEHTVYELSISTIDLYQAEVPCKEETA